MAVYQRLSRTREKLVHCSRGGFLKVWKTVVVERELDKLTACVNGDMAKDGNAVIIPAELVR